MLKVVVFDFDGVLVDSNVVKRNAYFDIFTSLGDTRPVVGAVLEDNRDGNRYQIIECILQRLVTAGFFSARSRLDKLVTKYAEQYNDICEKYAASCREINGVSTCLPWLAMRYVLYVNSATPEEPLCRIIRQRGWKCYFREVLGCSHTKTDNLRQILERERISCTEVVFVGDNQQDMTAALQCGCQFVGLVNDTSQFESEPSYIIHDFSELETTIEQIDRRCRIADDSAGE